MKHLGIYGYRRETLLRLVEECPVSPLEEAEKLEQLRALDNGIPIVSWFDDKDDTELLSLLPFLERLQNVEDVRPIVHNEFQTHKIIADAR